MVRCPHCDAEVSEIQHFCDKCGGRIKTRNVPIIENDSSAKPHKSFRLRHLLTGLITIAIIWGVAYLVLLSQSTDTDGPRAEAPQQLAPNHDDQRLATSSTNMPSSAAQQPSADQGAGDANASTQPGVTSTDRQNEQMDADEEALPTSELVRKDHKPLDPASLQSEALFQQGRKCFDVGQYDQAVQYFEQALAGGHSDAQAYLGEIFANGWSGAPRMDRAFELYSVAAEHGSTHGMINLGQLYQNGVPEIELEANPETAFKLFHRAADLGDKMGLFYVGECYEQGVGVPYDLEQAKNYYRLSAVKGHQPAAERLKNLEANS